MMLEPGSQTEVRESPVGIRDYAFELDTRSSLATQRSFPLCFSETEIAMFVVGFGESGSQG
jgi:hypothetical protein